jgi:proteic killer suppression protein
MSPVNVTKKCTVMAYVSLALCTVIPYSRYMIKTFTDRGLKAFFETGSTRRLSVQDRARVERIRNILQALNAATYPGQMDQPGWVFHAIPEIRAGYYAVKVTGNWRITFAFDGQDAINVNLEDYH